MYESFSENKETFRLYDADTPQTCFQTGTSHKLTTAIYVILLFKYSFIKV